MIRLLCAVLAVVWCVAVQAEEPSKRQVSEQQDSEQQDSAMPGVSAQQLVVMIDGRFPTSGALTSGAGIVVGRKGGFVYIATARHVVESLTDFARDIKVQFADRPGVEFEAQVARADFDKGIDLALLFVPETALPPELASRSTLPAARLATQPSEGDGIFFVGQPSGRPWSGNAAPEPLFAARATALEITSQSVDPGMSGGAALDEGFRIVGLVIETEGGVVRAIPIGLIKDILERGGHPFDLTDGEAAAEPVEIDPLKELVARGYDLSRHSNPRTAASLEFRRALEMRRAEDAELFLAVGTQLDAELIYERVRVPEDLTARALEAGLLNWDPKSLEAWCASVGITTSVWSGSNSQVPAEFDALREIVRAGNPAFIRSACGDDYERILSVARDYVERYERLEREIGDLRGNRPEIVASCKSFFAEKAPIAEMVAKMLRLAFSEPGAYRSWREESVAATEEFFSSQGSDRIRYRKNRISCGPLQGADFSCLYSKLEEQLYSHWNYPVSRDGMLMRRSGPISIADALRQELEGILAPLCEERIEIVDLSPAENEAYEAAKVFLDAR